MKKPVKIVARSRKPVLVIAETTKAFDAWLAEKGVKRTSSRQPVSAVVDGQDYVMAQLNTRAGALGRQNFSRVVWVNCEEKAFEWFADLVNSRVK